MSLEERREAAAVEQRAFLARGGDRPHRPLDDGVVSIDREESRSARRFDESHPPDCSCGVRSCLADRATPSDDVPRGRQW